MRQIDENILREIYSDDIIYHYTKATSAIDYILYKQELKFSHRKKSNDPIENRIFSLTRIGTGGLVAGTVENERKIKNNYPKASIIYNSLKERADLFCQICFCRNSRKEDGFFSFLRQAEEFGFTKPRMWEQYAEDYNGVCIALSKKKILEKNKDLDIIDNNIRYATYKELKEKNQYIKILKIEDEGYEKELIDIQNKELFIKHQDYSGENEYRICTLKKQENYKDDMFLDIEGCIIAIIISEKANRRQKESLVEYANEMQVPYFNIVWNDNGIDIINEEYCKNIFDKRRLKFSEDK